MPTVCCSQKPSTETQEIICCRRSACELSNGSGSIRAACDFVCGNYDAYEFIA